MNCNIALLIFIHVLRMILFTKRCAFHIKRGTLTNKMIPIDLFLDSSAFKSFIHNFLQCMNMKFCKNS